jgi:hypothetical protein
MVIIMTCPFELLRAGGVRFDVHTIRLMGGIAGIR